MDLLVPTALYGTPNRTVPSLPPSPHEQAPGVTVTGGVTSIDQSLVNSPAGKGGKDLPNNS